MEGERWISDLSELLKRIERDRSLIREFRRSFEAGKKKRQVSPQLEKILAQSRSHLNEENFISWFDQQEFKLTLGLKEISLKSYQEPLFKNSLLQLFSNWDPTISAPSILTTKSMPISAKKLKQVISRLGSVSDSELSNILSSIPKEELANLTASNEMFQTEETRALAEQITERVKMLR